MEWYLFFDNKASCNLCLIAFAQKTFCSIENTETVSLKDCLAQAFYQVKTCFDHSTNPNIAQFGIGSCLEAFLGFIQ